MLSFFSTPPPNRRRAGAGAPSGLGAAAATACLSRFLHNSGTMVMLSSVRRGSWNLASRAAVAASRSASRETRQGTVALRLWGAQQDTRQEGWTKAAALLMAGTGLLGAMGAMDVAHNEAAATPTEEPLASTEEAVAATAAAAAAAARTAGKVVKTSGMKLFSGNANTRLAAEIAGQLGMNLGKITVSRFADGEVNVMVHENVRGKDVYIVQPTCSPVNENLMELLLMVSTMRRSSARRITAVIPYYGYARQDRKMQARVPISAADVARLLEAMGVDRVVAVDLHCGQIQGFFGPRVPVDNLDGGTVGVSYFGDKDLHNPVIVSPDAGGVYRAKKFREGLAQKYDVDAGLAMIIKQRARANEVDRMDLVGSVVDSDVVIVDDMIDTAGTLAKAADVLVANGARRVYSFASHGLFSGPANERIFKSKLEEVVVLNTIPLTPAHEANAKIVQLSVAPLIAQAIYNIHQKKSISALFK